LEGFGLSLHPDKTRMIEFGPYARLIAVLENNREKNATF
jgi:hypothetical protein